MSALGSVIKFLGIALSVLASLANLIIGLTAFFSIFGALAVIGIVLFPLTIGLYPFIAWIFEGDTSYFVLWGSLWGAFILGGVIAAIGSKLSGEEE